MHARIIKCLVSAQMKYYPLTFERGVIAPVGEHALLNLLV